MNDQAAVMIEKLKSLKEDHLFFIIDALNFTMVPMFALNKKTNEYSFIILGDSVSALHSLAIESGIAFHRESVEYLHQDFKELIPEWQKYDRFLLDMSAGNIGLGQL